MKNTALLCCAFLLGACLAQPSPVPIPTATESLPFVIKQEDNPYAPRPADTSRRRREVILTSTNLSERSDLTPIQNELHILGSMPSTCSELRVMINPPNRQYQIFVEVYSVVDPILKCDNVFQQFNAAILLGIYSTGRYTIWVNDGYVGDFVSIQDG
ncbi:MAG: hypothetical protein HY863_04040 [Chloroflexi bacterium]|nr:hypothetical protein [Chloroflexota bacterium]